MVAVASLEPMSLPAMLEPERRAQFGRVLGGLAVAVLVAAVGDAVLLNAGPHRRRVRGGEVTNSPDRVHVACSSNNRLSGGARRGTSLVPTRSSAPARTPFEVARKRYRETASPVTAAAQRPAAVPRRHWYSSAWRSFVALVAAAAAAAVGARPAARGAASVTRLRPCPSRSRSGSSHALVDYDWDFVAVTGACTSSPPDALAASGTARRRGAGRCPLAAALQPLWRSPRSVSVVDAVAGGPRSVRRVNVADRPRRSCCCRRLCRSNARSLTRCPSEPVVRSTPASRSSAARRRRALADYREAARAPAREPGERGYRLGLYEFRHRRPLLGAYRASERGVHARSRPASSGRRGGPLDLARAWVNDGNC